jgi:hypothetical protein
MRLPSLSRWFALPSVGFLLCLSAPAWAKGPEWFDPAPAKPSSGKGQGETPNEPLGEGAPGATHQGEAEQAPPAAPRPPPARVAKPKPSAPPQIEWYVWQTMASDLTAISLLALSSGIENKHENASTLAAVVGVGFYALGAPLVHAANGQVGKGFGSLGLRLGAPLVGVLGGLATGAASCPGEPRPDELPGGSGSSNLCPVAHAALGFLLGSVTAIVVDASVLAKKEVLARPAVSFAPFVVPTSGGSSLGLAGSF